MQILKKYVDKDGFSVRNPKKADAILYALVATPSRIIIDEWPEPIKVERTEADLRQELKDQYGDNLLWIEYGSGGTAGMPDALYCPGGGVAIGLELKRAKKKLRASQKKVAEQFIKKGLMYLVLRPEGYNIGVYHILDMNMKMYAYLEIISIEMLYRAIVRFRHNDVAVVRSRPGISPVPPF